MKKKKTMDGTKKMETLKGIRGYEAYLSHIRLQRTIVKTRQHNPKDDYTVFKPFFIFWLMTFMFSRSLPYMIH
jgi:hypothetical protein